MPTNPVKAEIRSNVVPPLKVNNNKKFTKKPTEEDLGRLRISLLKIQDKHSSNKKNIKRDKGDDRGQHRSTTYLILKNSDRT